MDEITTTPKKRRKISLTKADRRELIERREIELAVSFFLDLDQDRSVKQIAEEMGKSVSALKRMTATAEFQEIYDEQLMQLGHHPRLQALSANLPELAPLAYRALKRLLGPGIAHTAQVGAVKLLFDTLKISEQVREEDPAALGNFLASKGVAVQNNTININLPIPQAYQDAFQKYMGGDVVEGHATDIGNALQAGGTADTPEGLSREVFPTSESPASSPPERSEGTEASASSEYSPDGS